MKKMKLFLTAAFLLTLLLTLSACGSELAAELQQGQETAEAAATEVDPVAIFTSAAATVNAQITQTAAAFSPTPPPATSTPIPQPTATLVQVNTPLTGVTATLDPALPTFTATVIGAATSIPTATLAVINTQEGPICDSMTYDPSTLDQNYADGTDVPAGTNFEKVWRIYNNGTCTWDDGYELVYYSSVSSRGDSNPLDAAPVAFKIGIQSDNVPPGGTVDVGAKLTAPLDNGDYTAYFVLRNDRGEFFGGFLSVVIKVTDGK